MIRNTSVPLLLLCVLLFLSACTAAGPETRYSSDSLSIGICRVAVLPFINHSKDNSAGIVAYRVFSSELIASGLYSVVPEGDVQLFLQRKRLLPGALLDSGIYRELGSELGVDAVISGKVLDLESTSSGRDGEIPEVALQTQIINVSSGQPLVYTYNRRSGEDYRTFLHFGVVRTKSELLAVVSREIIADWQTKGISHCSVPE